MNAHIATEIFKKHRTGFIFALIIVVFVVGPEILMRLSLGDRFEGIYMHGSDSELMYLARMQQTYNGVSAWDNPFLYEYRGELPLSYMLFSEPILAYPGKWLGIPVPELNLVYKTIFSGIIFLLIYFLTFRVTNSILWSVVAATMIMAGYRLVTIPGILNIIQWKQAYTQFSVYSRPVTTQVSWVIFWSFLHIMFSGITGGRWKYFLLCGVLFGAAFYVYPYNWTFLAAFTGTVIAGALLMRQTKLAVQLMVILCIGAILGIPYFLNSYAVTHNPYFGNFSVMTELVGSHEPDVSRIGLVVAFLLFLSIYRKGYNPQVFYLVTLIITTFIVTNQQVITGQVLQVGHYHLFFNVPIYILTLTYLAWRESQVFKVRYVRFALIFVILLSLVNMYLMQSSSYFFQTGAVTQNQKLAGIFNWLKSNTLRGDVILANGNISNFLPAYTHNRPYWNGYALFYLMPVERMEVPLFLRLKLSGIAPKSLGGESFFHTNPNESQLQIAEKADLEDILAGNSRKIYPEGALQRYEDFYRQSWENNLSHYKLDYVVVDTTNVVWDLKNIKFLKQVARAGDIIVYENTLY